jgi:hypothetical protein
MLPWLRSILSVLAGYVAIMVIVIVLTAILNHVLGLDNDRLTPAYVVISLAYIYLASGVGGYLTARLAGRAPLTHGGALAVVLLIFSAFTLSKGFGGQGTGYVVALSLGRPLFCMAGAYVRARQVHTFD